MKYLFYLKNFIKDFIYINRNKIDLYKSVKLHKFLNSPGIDVNLLLFKSL